MKALEAGGEFALAHVKLVDYRLPLRRPLETARVRIGARDGVLLGLVDGDGFSGWGEAAPFPGFHAETAADCRRSLAAALGPGLETRPASAWLGEAEARLAGRPAARAALDGALHDLVARREGRSLASLLAPPGVAPRHSVAVNALVSADAPEQAGKAAREALESGFRTVKLKLRDDGRDLERVDAVRRALGPEPALRLDANGAWDEIGALRAAERLAAFDVAYIEQPLAPGRPEALARLRHRSAVAIAADEDAVDAGSVERLIALRAVDWLVLKPSACGGVGRALALSRRAADAGIGVVVTSLIEGAVGRATALQLAAALDPAPPACGLATGAWLTRDLASGPEPRGGQLALPPGSGIGVAPAEVEAWIG
ncbi:MAG: o-succinylbenzoate synthase [Myxococcota bacterium]